MLFRSSEVFCIGSMVCNIVEFPHSSVGDSLGFPKSCIGNMVFHIAPSGTRFCKVTWSSTYSRISTALGRLTWLLGRPASAPVSAPESDEAKSTQPKTIRHQLVQQCLGVGLGLCSRFHLFHTLCYEMRTLRRGRSCGLIFF